MASTSRACSSLDTHIWTRGDNTFLSLADNRGWLDVFRSWRCVICGCTTWATGALTPETSPLSPTEWQTQADLQQRHGDLYGGAVRQQERWERERRGLSRRLQAPGREEKR